MDWGSKIEDWGLRIKNLGSRIEDWGSRIEEWGFKIKHQGLRIQDSRSSIRDWGSRNFITQKNKSQSKIYSYVMLRPFIDLSDIQFDHNDQNNQFYYILPIFKMHTFDHHLSRITLFRGHFKMVNFPLADILHLLQGLMKGPRAIGLRKYHLN